MEIRCRPGEIPLVVGPRPLATTETFEAGTTIVGARLQPGTGPAVLGVAASELVDSSVSLDQLWGPAARRLGERITEAGSAQETRTLLESAIHAGPTGEREPDPLVQAAVDAIGHGNHRVASLAETLDISPRQLRRRCIDAVGFGPKTLQRILRFQRFLTAAHVGTAGDLARVAAQLGYTDQAHLTFESKRLSGHTPDSLKASIARSCRDHDHTASLRH
jgi:AraC-like DNA-binding protein